MTLQDWLDRLEEWDPDGWLDVEHLRNAFSAEDLVQEVEGEITFRTEGGEPTWVLIQLLSQSGDILVEEEVELLALDGLVLLNFLALRYTQHPGSLFEVES